MMDNIDRQAMMRAGTIGGVAIFLVGLVGAFFPILSLCICFLPLLIGLGTGAYYVTLASANRTVPQNLQNGGMGGAAAGAFVGAGAALASAIGLAVVSLLGMGASAAAGDAGSAALYAGTGMAGTLGAIIQGLIFGVLWGAVGGAAYAWYLNRNNPTTPSAPPPM